MTTELRTRSDFRPDIEGLRGVAVLLVVAYHVGIMGVTGGFVGVDVFFVLSGYLITGLLVKEAERAGRVDLLRFYGRRARRLLPAFGVVMAATISAAILVASPLQELKWFRSASASSLYVGNVWFARVAMDYFADSAQRNPFLHTWSLAVEEQFYLTWPLLVALSWRGTRRKRRTIAMIAAIVGVSFLLCVWETRVRQPWAFFGTPLRAWEFGAGALLAFLPERAFRTNPLATGTLGAVGLLLLAWAAFWLSPTTRFPGYAAALPVLGAAAVIAAGSRRQHVGASRLLAAPGLQYLGRLSYSWYLWHWPVLVLATVAAPALGIAGRIACAVVALAIADLTYRLVEAPIRFGAPAFAPPARALAMGLAVTLGCALLASTAERGANRAAHAPDQRPFLEASMSVLAESETAPCTSPIIDGASAPRECVFGDTSSERVVVLFGDSHAAQWLPALEPIAGKHHWRLVTLLKLACPAAAIEVYSIGLARPFSECSAWRRSALERILHRHPAAVILASYAQAVEQRSPDESYAPVAPDEWRTGYRRVLAPLDSAGIRTIVLRDTPSPRESVPVCLSRIAAHRWESAHACDRDRDAALNVAAFRATTEAALGLGHSRVLDLSDLFCGAIACEAVRSGVIVYRDQNHVTARYVEALVDPVAQRIVPLLDGSHPDARTERARRLR